MRIHRWSLVFWLAVAACSTSRQPTGPRVSEFGRYDGFTEPVYAEWVRESRYVPMRDGVKLAADIIRPAVNGVAVEQVLPVVWTHSRYHRTPPNMAAATASRDLSALREGGHPETAGAAAGDSTPASPIRSMVDASPSLQRLVRHGYVVVSVDVRGGGASYGRYEGLFSPAETRDAYDVMQWMTTQPWCDGNIGMFGGSYLGITQYMAASTRHPALKAIFPTVAAFDLYDVLYTGGIYRQNMMEHWGILTRNLDVNYMAPPVDEDRSPYRADPAFAACSAV
jgi:hypothetical protein